MTSAIKILCIVGARPNFMKIAPLMRAFSATDIPIEAKLIHTGQHYDVAMNEQFFHQLGIPEPDINLEVGSGGHGRQTGQIMVAFEPIVEVEKPDAVLVVGDVNSTIACALVAVKKGVKVIHVEAGLRSFDRTMPEEINRVLTDKISDYLFTTEEAALDNLLNEGIRAEQVFFTGNVMIDTLYANLEQTIPAQETLSKLNASHLFHSSQEFAVLTLHRPSNVDNVEVLSALLDTIVAVSKKCPLVFPVHPRTQNQMKQHGLDSKLHNQRVVLSGPLGYLELLGLIKKAKLVLTDSGGLQEETTALGVPCLTLRESTERPITVIQGTNTIVGNDGAKILQTVDDIFQSGGKAGRIPPLWDGEAAGRVAEILVQQLCEKQE